QIELGVARRDRGVGRMDPTSRFILSSPQDRRLNEDTGLNVQRSTFNVQRSESEDPHICVVQAFVLFVPQPNKAASPAGENPAMVNDDEPSSHNRLGSVGDPAQASSVVKVLTGAGQARLQAAP